MFSLARVTGRSGAAAAAQARRPRHPRSAGVLVSALVLAGCSGGGDAGDELVRTSVCAVSPPSGFADAGLGSEVFGQVRSAVAQGAADTTSSQRVGTASQSRAALERFSAEACTLTLAVGPGTADEVAAVARESPAQAFLTIGMSPEDDLPSNVLRLDFDLRDAAYLSGFAAGSATESGTVAISVARGFPQGAELLTAFDEGVRAYAEEHDEDVEVLDEGTADARIVSDSPEAGSVWAESGVSEGADVLASFGSAAPQGAAEVVGEIALQASADPDGDEADGDVADGDEADGDTADGEAAEAETVGEDVESGVDEPGEAEDDAPSLIWYGADAAHALPAEVSRHTVLSVVPDVGLGLRALLQNWPGDGGDPAELSADEAGRPGAAADTPELVAGLEVRSRWAVADVSNEGVQVVPNDGALTAVTGLGRELAAERDRMEERAADD